jgi:UDP-N-acetyl-2-amino-2-deoxyglucuronate dehydrogenase
VLLDTSKGDTVAKLRVGVIGLEHYHVTGWVESIELFPEQLEIVALYDPDPARGEALAPTYYDPHLAASLSQSYRSVPFFTDLDALLSSEKIDLALVTLPNAAIPDAIIRLARAGVHMLVDKPGARTAAEAEPAFRAAREAGVKVAVGLGRRYGSGWQDAKAMIDRGRLGKLLTTEAIFTTSSVKVRNPTNLIFDREQSGGGILHWLGVHDIDQLLWLTGDRIVEVQALASNVSGQPIEVEDAISVGLRYASGALGTIHYAYALPRTGSDGYLAFRGVNGSIKIAPDGTLTWFGGGTPLDPVINQETVYTSRSVPGYGATGAAVIEDLILAIEEDRDPLATGEDVTQALRVIDAAYEAAQTGQRVQLV